MSKRLVGLSTVAILLAAASGGGFDMYARVLSRHMGRHIPAIRPTSSRT